MKQGNLTINEEQFNDLFALNLDIKARRAETVKVEIIKKSRKK